MNHRPDDFEAEERELQDLFDATAPPPDQAALHRMARSAATIPDTHRVESWWSRLFGTRARYAGLALVGAAAIVGAVWVTGGTGGERVLPAPSPVAVNTTTAAPTAAPSPAPDVVGDELDLDDVELDENDMVLAYDTGEDEDLDPLAGIDLLFGPEEGDDEDAFFEGLAGLEEDDG